MLRQVFIDRQRLVGLITTLTTTPNDLVYHEPAALPCIHQAPASDRLITSRKKINAMDMLAAARLGDEVAHGFGVAAMVAGAVAGALIGAAVVAATVVTGGVALAIMAGSIAAGGLSMFQIIKGLEHPFQLGPNRPRGR